MKVTFYGTRGSIPVCDPHYFKAGGHTPSISVVLESGRILILDAGTGIRKLGKDLSERPRQDNIYILLTHTHLDHIHGFPFFQPAYDPEQHLTMSICGLDRGSAKLEAVMGVQMQRDYYPVSLDRMGADIAFWEPDVTQYTVDHDVGVEACPVGHPGGAFGYRIEDAGKSLVYCTDVEHANTIDPNVVALSSRADLLIHDAQYTPEELRRKKGWGHSSWEEATKVAEQAQVKRLALFHHDPEHDDTFLFEAELEAHKRFPDAFLAREGMEIEF